MEEEEEEKKKKEEEEVKFEGHERSWLLIEEREEEEPRGQFDDQFDDLQGV